MAFGARFRKACLGGFAGCARLRSLHVRDKYGNLAAAA